MASIANIASSPRKPVLAAALAALLSAVAPTAMSADGISADARTAALFGMTQADNLATRMGRLRSAHDRCDQFDIGTNTRWERAPEVEEDRPVATGGPRLMDALLGASCGGTWSFWTGGNLDIGALRPSSADDRTGVQTSGLTAGADRAIGDRAKVGAAIGYARQAVRVEGDSSQDARGQSAILYASVQPWSILDVDALVGVGRAALESDADSAAPSADRSAHQVFGSLALHADVVGRYVRLTPYARYDLIRNQFDALGVDGQPTFGDATANEDVLALGIYADVTFTVAATTLAPAVRLEQRRVRSVLDAHDETSAITAAERTLASFALPFRSARATSLAFEYALASSTDAPRSETVRATLQTPF